MRKRAHTQCQTFRTNLTMTWLCSWVGAGGGGCGDQRLLLPSFTRAIMRTRARRALRTAGARGRDIVGVYSRTTDRQLDGSLPAVVFSAFCVAYYGRHRILPPPRQNTTTPASSPIVYAARTHALYTRTTATIAHTHTPPRARLYLLPSRFLYACSRSCLALYIALFI